jgi:ADP-heptose:LPS heptosyltransferase/glycosyltransferase involved in cell wall biosynthesis
MRIIIDLQGAQTGSRYRGIGRSSIARARALVRNRGDHDISILLNGAFEETIDPIVNEFSAILPRDRIVVFSTPLSVAGINEENAWRSSAAKLIREWIIDALAPDAVLVTSLFEGLHDAATISIGRLETRTKTAVIVHDLIPLLDPETYLGYPPARNWYYSQVDSLMRANLLLAVSNYSRLEAIDALGLESEQVVAVSSGADERFIDPSVSPEEARALLERLGIRGKFILHVSKAEPRKNFDGLLRAFRLLPSSLRETHQLVQAGEYDDAEQAVLRSLAESTGLTSEQLVLAGHVPDRELIALYSQCAVFVFPSFHEGFGLPALEAMACGAPVIGSNATSIPEVLGRQDALFNPHSDHSIARLLERVLTDNQFRLLLKAHAIEWSKNFDWNRSARLTLTALETMIADNADVQEAPDISALFRQIAKIEVGVLPDQKDLIEVANSISRNETILTEIRSASDLHFSSNVHALAGAEIETIRRRVWLPEEHLRILLLKLDHIGDFVMTLDAFRLIRDTWPKADITLICGPWNEAVAKRSGLFDTVVSCSFYPDNTTSYDKDAVVQKGIAEYRALNLDRFDLAVDLRSFDDNRMLLSYADARYRAGYAADGVQLDLALPVSSEAEMVAHIGARTLALAAAVAWTFGVPVGGGRETLLDGRSPVRLFAEGTVIGISPGSRNALRAWGRERFAALARLLEGYGQYRIVLFGSEADRSDTQFISEMLPKAHVADMAGKLAVDELPSVFAGLDVFIGGETGTTHMAALIGVPTICIYSGQTNVESFRPVGPHVVTLRGKVACSPCFLASIDDCRWNKRCMDIPPARVAAEAIALLERIGSRRLMQ